MKEETKQFQLSQHRKTKTKYQVWAAEFEYFLDTMTMEKWMRLLLPQKKMSIINSGIQKEKEW